MANIFSKRYREALPADKNAEMLDVACGPGHFIFFLGKEGYKNSRGIDVSKEQVELAVKFGIAGVETADFLEFLPENPGKYDMITAFDIIEHLKKDEVVQFLDLVHASLKPGGSVLIGTMNASSLLGARNVFIDFTHETGFTPESLSQIMRVCGFETVNVRGEGPAVHDLRSAMRALLWGAVKKMLKLYKTIEAGTGRGMFFNDLIFEPRMFALGKKPRA